MHIPTEENPIKVLIVEDAPLTRDLLRDELLSIPRFQVVGAVGDGQTAIDLAGKLLPQVVLMDIGLPGGIDGIEAGRRIKAQNSDTGIVLLTYHDEASFVKRIPRGPGWSFLLKQSSSNGKDTLIQTLEQTARGFVVIDPEVIKLLEPKSNSSYIRLSPRCQLTLKYMAQGDSNETIASKMGIDKRAVEKNINTIFNEYGCSGDKSIVPRIDVVLQYLRETGSLKDSANN